MSQNPLQQFFRQPKIYISLPSNGVFNQPGVIQGEASNMPVYGMTGMDEILIKTPDALYSGETTVKVIESCCPAIKNGWDVSNLDVDLILTAIRIATFGNLMEVEHVCPGCKTTNDYTLELSKLIDHYTNCKFENKIVLKDLVIKIQPLNYKQLTEFSIKNAQLQQRIRQADKIENDEERATTMNALFKDIALVQNEALALSIESVEVGNTVVTERSYIVEWLENCDKIIFDSLKEHLNKNKVAWESPTHPVACPECGQESAITIEMDNASFFASA